MEQKNARGKANPSQQQNSKAANPKITSFFKKNTQPEQISSSPMLIPDETLIQKVTQQLHNLEQQQAASQQQQRNSQVRLSQNSTGRVAATEEKHSQQRESSGKRRSSRATPKKRGSKEESKKEETQPKNQQEEDNNEVEVEDESQDQHNDKNDQMNVDDDEANKQSQQEEEDDGEEDSDKEGKRKLRPRKINNYRQMLQDEVTMKTIKDEELEKKRMRDENVQPEEDDEYIINDEDMKMLLNQEVEVASDDASPNEDEEDEEEEEYALSKVRKHLTRKRRAIHQIDDGEEDGLSYGEEEKKHTDDSHDEEEVGAKRKKKQKEKKVARKKKNVRQKYTQDDEEEDYVNDMMAQCIYNEKGEITFLDNLPVEDVEIRRMMRDVKIRIKSLEQQFFEEEDSGDEEMLKKINNIDEHDEALEVFKNKIHLTQFWCIPMSVNVKEFNFQAFADAQTNYGGRLFDVITIDPPWQLSSANPTRGVAIAYETLNDRQILDIPFHKIQTDGFLFIWVINAKYRFALEIMEHFGYRLVDEVAWVKQTVNGKIAKGHGYYLQHAKETCLVGVKGNVKGKAQSNIESDVIFSQRRGQSQKPEEIYEIAEALVPNGYYLEIFGRRNNLHNGWVTIGNEL